MTATEYAIYDVCRALSAPHDGILYFSGPKLAKRFRSMSKNTPYTALKSLVDMKWFMPLDDPNKSRKDKATGKHSATRFKVLTHPEWAAKNPNCCPDHSADWKQALSQSQGTVTSTSQSQGMDHPKMRERSIQIRGDAPSQSQGTNLYKQPIQVTHISTDTLPLPSKLGGMAPVPSSLDGASEASAPIGRAAPFPQIGTVEARILRERGLVERDGVWRTQMGTTVLPDALAILIGHNA